MLGYHRPASERHLNGLLKVVFGSFLPSQVKKNVAKAGPPLTKLSGSAHDFCSLELINHRDLGQVKKVNFLHTKRYLIFYPVSEILVLCPGHTFTDHLAGSITD